MFTITMLAYTTPRSSYVLSLRFHNPQRPSVNCRLAVRLERYLTCVLVLAWVKSLRCIENEIKFTQYYITLATGVLYQL